MKATLTKIMRKEREGANGPYTSVLIKTQEHGDRLLSGFWRKESQNWKAGDQVEIEVKEVEKDGKKYLNFDVPKKENGNENSGYARTISIQLERIEEKIDRLMDFFVDKEVGKE